MKMKKGQDFEVMWQLPAITMFTKKKSWSKGITPVDKMREDQVKLLIMEMM